jgi:spore germination cell wall hydrolase CwlJ-like protein
MIVLSSFTNILISVMLSTGNVPPVSIEQAACLMEAVYFEAGNESKRGKDAVAHVILNRSKDLSFPSNLCDIVRQKGQFSYHKLNKRIFKFNQNDSFMVKNLSDSADAALRATSGVSKDPTNGALFFVNIKLASYTNWLVGMKRTTVIENHNFYKFNRKPTPTYAYM